MLPALFAGAQSNPLDAKLQRAAEQYNDGKKEEAEKAIEKITSNNPEYGDGWDMLAKIRYNDYEEAKKTDALDLFSGKIAVTTKDKNGKDVPVENDTMATQLMNMLNKLKPSRKAYNKYLYTMREGTLHSHLAEYCSVMLRRLFVDNEVDTAVSKRALKYYDEGEKEFAAKNYGTAAAQYKRAIEEQPDFYKARLYLGDAQFAAGDYADAIGNYTAAHKKYPDQMEPVKFLIDAYHKEGLEEKALQACIDAMLIYPDVTVYGKLDDEAYLNHKKMTAVWLPRPVFPNQLPDTTEGINAYEPEEKETATGSWAAYTKAFDKVKIYCTAGGMLKANPVTSNKYLEVYTWEEMLKNNTDPEMETARQMQQKDYLDCYVLITCFHYDLYPQYRDFVTHNREKAQRYFQLILAAQ